MTKRILAVACLALAAAFLAPAAQAGSDVDRATGGGQVLIGTRGGAGDTIAFTARGTASAARGQVQYVDRTATGQTVFHGTVLCLSVQGNRAKLAGVWDRQGSGNFELIVVDNGQGTAAENDSIVIQPAETNPQCGDDGDDGDEPEIALARGNAQVYDATP